MNTLPPLEVLYDREHGSDVPLPPELAALYGRLQLPAHQGRPYLLGNVVTTLDGVVSLNIPDQSGGGPISSTLPEEREQKRGGNHAFHQANGKTSRPASSGE